MPLRPALESYNTPQMSVEPELVFVKTGPSYFKKVLKEQSLKHDTAQ